MKIFTYPKNFTEDEAWYLAQSLNQQTDENFILIREDIKYTDLSLKELYGLKKEIEIAIQEKEESK